MRRFFIFMTLSSIFLWGGLFDFKTIEKATKAYENEEYDKSLLLLKSLSKDSPHLNYNIGNVYYQKGEHEKAIEFYQNAQGADPFSLEYNMGNAYAKQGKFDEAIDAYSRALEIRDDENARINLDIVKRVKKEQSKQKQQNKQPQGSNPQEDDKNSDDDEENNSSNQYDQNSTKQQPKPQEEKKTNKELEHLLKKVQSKQMPTLLYGIGEPEGRDDANPW